GLHTDVIVANGRAAHRRKKEDVRASQREAARGLGHNEVVTNQHPGRAEIRRGKNRERSPSPTRPCLSPRRANLVISANLLAITTEQKGRVVDRSVTLGEVAA